MRDGMLFSWRGGKLHRSVVARSAIRCQVALYSLKTRPCGKSAERLYAHDQPLAVSQPLRRRATKLPPQRVIEIVCSHLGADIEEVRQRRRGSLLRPIMAKMLCRYSALTQRQAGEFLNLSTGAAVSIQLKNLTAAVSSKRKIRKQLSEVEEAIRKAID